MQTWLATTFTAAVTVLAAALVRGGPRTWLGLGCCGRDLVCRLIHCLRDLSHARGRHGNTLCHALVCRGCVLDRGQPSFPLRRIYCCIGDPPKFNVRASCTLSCALSAQEKFFTAAWTIMTMDRIIVENIPCPKRLHDGFARFTRKLICVSQHNTDVAIC